MNNLVSHPPLILPPARNFLPNPYGNDPSCASLPNLSLNRSIYDRRYAWSNIPFITDYGDIFYFLIRFLCNLDSRNLLRASRCNGWVRGDGIECSHPDGRKLAVERMKSCFGYSTLKNKDIARARLIYAFLNPDKNLIGLELHHIHPNSLYPKAIHTYTAATDDRIDNLIPLTPEQHKLVHYQQGDESFYHYSQSQD